MLLRAGAELRCHPQLCRVDAVKPVFEALCKGAEANPDEIDEDEVLSF